MDWKELPTWLKGGIIGLVVPPFLFIVSIFLGILGLVTENYDIPIIYNLMIVVSVLSCPVCYLSAYFIKNSALVNFLIMFSIFVSFFSWFLIGAGIGFFISIIRKKYRKR